MIINDLYHHVHVQVLQEKAHLFKSTDLAAKCV